MTPTHAGEGVGLETELREGVSWLRLDDGKVNALTHALMDAIVDALERAERDARAVVITGRPGQLSAGFDLSVLLSGLEPARALVRRGARFFLRVYAHPQPVVVACTGNAVAGGALLLACADARLAVDGAHVIGMNEAQRGLPLPIFARRLVSERLDPRWRTEALLFGALVGPRRALEMGWLDRIVAADALEAEAQREALRLAALPPRSFAQIKEALRGPLIGEVEDTLEADLESLRDFLEGG